MTAWVDRQATHAAAVLAVLGLLAAAPPAHANTTPKRQVRYVTPEQIERAMFPLQAAAQRAELCPLPPRWLPSVC